MEDCLVFKFGQNNISTIDVLVIKDTDDSTVLLHVLEVGRELCLCLSFQPISRIRQDTSNDFVGGETAHCQHFVDHQRHTTDSVNAVRAGFGSGGGIFFFRFRRIFGDGGLFFLRLRL